MKYEKIREIPQMLKDRLSAPLGWLLLAGSFNTSMISPIGDTHYALFEEARIPDKQELVLDLTETAKSIATAYLGYRLIIRPKKTQN